ncbi:EscU/YscU/HrcU family type III secretion system export apparatus switch protein [Klebsiella pneumoniae]
MTREELRREMKESEGSPEVKPRPSVMAVSSG